MKKYIVAGLLVMAIVFSGVASTANAASLTADQINSIIGLLQVFGADATVIANVRMALSGGTPTNLPPPNTPPGNSFCYTFNQDFYWGTLGEDVVKLELALQRENLYVPDGRSLLDAIKRFQAKYGIPQTGFVGQLTRAKLNQLYRCNVSAQPSITRVDGPRTLNVGETGTWQVVINYPTFTTGKLSFFVKWGDEQAIDAEVARYVGPNTASGADDSAKFSHTYTVAGTYYPTFTIIDQNNQFAKTTITVRVGFATPSSVMITGITPSSFAVGSTIEIKGKNLNGFEGETSVYLVKENGETGSIGVNSYLPIGDSTLTFVLPNKICTQNPGASGLPCPSYMTITPGVYKVYVIPWTEKSNVMTFTVTSAGDPLAAPSISVLSPNGGETLKAGSTYLINWKGANLPFTAKIHIKLFKDFNGDVDYGLSNVIASGLSAKDTSFTWTIGTGGFPSVPYGGKYIIAVVATWGDFSAGTFTRTYDVSDTTFTISQ